MSCAATNHAMIRGQLKMDNVHGRGSSYDNVSVSMIVDTLVV